MELEGFCAFRIRKTPRRDTIQAPVPWSTREGQAATAEPRNFIGGKPTATTFQSGGGNLMHL